MSNYTKTTNFATKDALVSGNPAKIVKGTEIDTEFNNIAVASGTKADKASPTFTGTVNLPITTAASLKVGNDGVTVTGIKDEDDMASNSATKLASQQSIKAYVDSQVTAQDLDVTDGTTSISIDLDSEALSLLGGTGVTSTALGNGVTLAIDATVATLDDAQTLTNKTLTTPAITGALTTDSTIDGRDVAVDGAKLDGINQGVATTDSPTFVGINSSLFSIKNAAGDENMAVFTEDGSVRLYYNNGMRLQTGATGNYLVGTTILDALEVAFPIESSGIKLGDNDKATFGAGDDLQIYHDGTDSFISDQGTGNLKLLANDFRLANAANNELMIKADQSSAVTAYYAGAEKLATTSTGIDVTGNLQATGYLAVDGASGNTGAGTDRWIGGDGTTGTWFYNVPTGSNHYFAVNNANKLAISATGIDVTGTATMDGLTVDGAGTAVTLQGNNGAGTLNTLQFKDTDTATSTGQDIGRVEFYSADASAAGVQAYIAGQAAGGSGIGRLTFGTGAGGSAVDRLLIDSNGDISFYEDTGTTAKLFWDASAEMLTTSGLTVDSGAGDLTATFQSTDQFADIKLTDSGGSSYIRQSNGSLLLQADRDNASASSIVQMSVDGVQTARFAAGGDVSFYEDTGTTAKFFWDASAESLGIGTSSPQTSLSIETSGTQNVASPIVTGQTAGVTYGGLYTVRDGTGDQRGLALNVYTANVGLNEAMRIDSAGNVGIQSTDPTNNSVGGVGGLVIGNGTGNKGLTLFGSSTAQQNIAFTDTSNSQKGLIQYDHGGDYMRLFTSSIERMRIDSAGNVLVGTSDTFPGGGDTNTGVSLTSTGAVVASRDGDFAARFNRKTSNGEIIGLNKDGAPVGSIGVQGGANLLIGTGDTGIRFAASNNAIHPWNTSTLGLRDAAIDLGADSIRFKDLYLSGGVYLGGTGAANKLDDYEEGDYLAAVTMGSGTLTLNTSFNRLSYTKVGRLVTVTGLLIASAGSGLGGSVRINLPFTCASLTGRAADSAGSLSVVNSASCPSGSFGLRVTEGSSDVYIFDGSGTTTINAGSSMASNVQLYLSITYVTI